MSRANVGNMNDEKKINDITKNFENEFGLEGNEIPRLKFESYNLSEKQKKQQIEIYFLKVFEKLEKLKLKKKIQEQKQYQDINEKNEENNNEDIIDNETEKKVTINKYFGLVFIILIIVIFIYNKLKTK
jgi:preprotein translocase subunit SecF